MQKSTIVHKVIGSEYRDGDKLVLIFEVQQQKKRHGTPWRLEKVIASYLSK